MWGGGCDVKGEKEEREREERKGKNAKTKMIAFDAIPDKSVDSGRFNNSSSFPFTVISKANMACSIAVQVYSIRSHTIYYMSSHIFHKCS